MSRSGDGSGNRNRKYQSLRSLKRSRGRHTGDRRTLHAACPIPWGEKWVINYWVGERGQDGAGNITALNLAP